ncbi:MAG: thiamine pyrophosphate-binding protein [Alphaproteobacteria bacterium]|nr:thiamine pyrophosphate-binding protein [Alphaproteobacteria bacterium]
MTSRRAAQILVDQLKIHGVDMAFGVPGESYLALLDALHDANSIRLIVCRQEGGAAMMADAYGKLTGQPGLCLVTRGPGATNATAGIHVAMQDSTPMIVLIGQVARDARGREALQELDYKQFLGGMVKYVEEIADPRRIPEYVSRAFHVATGGRPGPVALALPEDMLEDMADVGDAEPYSRIEPHPSSRQLEALAAILATAERPMLLLGGSQWDAAAVRQIETFAERFALPVCTGFRRQDRFDNRHACFAGDLGIAANPRLAARVRDADVLIAVGGRLGEATTAGYSLVVVPHPRQTLVHVHPDPGELGRVYQPALAINASPRTFAPMAVVLQPARKPHWAAETEAAHRDYLAFVEPSKLPGALQLGPIVRWLDGHLPADAIWCNGAGNFAGWVHRHHQYRAFGTQLAPASGSMGYGFPAAVAARLVHPERPVVCFCGDGDFLMTGQELATAVRYRLPIVALIVNNGMYGTIRMHQETHFPGRTYGTDLVNPDFAALARAYGAHGESVERTDDFAAAFTRAATAGKPAVLDLKVDPEAITTRSTIADLRAAAKTTH